MSKRSRSARGQIVDFDLLAIKQQLAVKPVPVSVNERREFIDSRDGLKARSATPVPVTGPMALGIEAEQISASAKKK